MRLPLSTSNSASASAAAAAAPRWYSAADPGFLLFRFVLLGGFQLDSYDKRVGEGELAYFDLGIGEVVAYDAAGVRIVPTSCSLTSCDDSGAAAQGSSACCNGGACECCDGDESTMCATDPADEDPRLLIDLGTVERVSKVRIVNGQLLGSIDADGDVQNNGLVRYPNDENFVGTYLAVADDDTLTVNPSNRLVPVAPAWERIVGGDFDPSLPRAQHDYATSVIMPRADETIRPETVGKAVLPEDFTRISTNALMDPKEHTRARSFGQGELNTSCDKT